MPSIQQPFFLCLTHENKKRNMFKYIFQLPVFCLFFNLESSGGVRSFFSQRPFVFSRELLFLVGGVFTFIILSFFFLKEQFSLGDVTFPSPCRESCSFMSRKIRSLGESDCTSISALLTASATLPTDAGTLLTLDISHGRPCSIGIR